MGQEKRKELMGKVLLSKPIGASVEDVAVLIDNQSGGDNNTTTAVLKHSKVGLMALCVNIVVMY